MCARNAEKKKISFNWSDLSSIVHVLVVMVRFFIIIIYFMFQRHRSAPLLAGRKWSLPAIATASYYRQTYPKAHAHDRLVGYVYYNYYCMGTQSLSQVRSSVVVSRVAHARRVIYAEIDAITYLPYIILVNGVICYRGRGNTPEIITSCLISHTNTKTQNGKKRPQTRVKERIT